MHGKPPWRAAPGIAPNGLAQASEPDARHCADNDAADRAVFARLEAMARRGSQMRGTFGGPGTNPLEFGVDRYDSPLEPVIDGRRFISFGSNNYLGLSFDADAWQAAVEAYDRYGLGATTSRVASGTTALHRELEARISRFVGKSETVTFSSGFLANLGTIAGLTDSRHALAIDEDCHASIFDAARLSTAKKLKFRHNDPGHLEKVIAESGYHPSSILIVTESLFSAMGDEAAIEDIVAVKRRTGARLLVDEAHSLGCYGAQGRGFCAERGVLDDVDVLTGTFSKAVGSIGGFAASSHPDFDYLRYLARGYLFTAALPPVLVAAIVETFDKIEAGDALRTALWHNARTLHRRLVEQGHDVPPAPTPIVTLRFPDIVTGYRVWQGLFDAGIYTNALLPPATRTGIHAIRLSISALHRPEHLDLLCAALESAGSELPRAATGG